MFDATIVAIRTSVTDMARAMIFLGRKDQVILLVCFAFKAMHEPIRLSTHDPHVNHPDRQGGCVFQDADSTDLDLLIPHQLRQEVSK